MNILRLEYPPFAQAILVILVLVSVWTILTGTIIVLNMVLTKEVDTTLAGLIIVCTAGITGTAAMLLHKRITNASKRLDRRQRTRARNERWRQRARLRSAKAENRILQTGP